MSLKTTILVCDDDPTDILLFKKYLGLSVHNYIVLEASTKEDIEHHLSHSAGSIKFIAMDYFLGHSTGIEWLRKIVSRNFAPVVMLTGQGDESIAVEVMKEGAFDYIPKDKLKDYDIEKLITDTIYRWHIERERDQLLGIAAHELRGPLAVIMGYTEMLTGFPDLPANEIPGIYSIIHERAEFLSGMIDRILDISRIERGRIELKKDSHNLSSAITKIAGQFKLIALRKRISIVVSGNREPAIAYCDIKRIEEVISNLIDNAIKFSPPESEILINISSTNNFVIVEIIDNGPGIKQEELSYLFDMFSSVKISNRPTAGESSSGLGLAICKKIVNLHQGKIEVETQPGKGTTFRLLLPCN